jgi:hypothetical protein
VSSEEMRSGAPDLILMHQLHGSNAEDRTCGECRGEVTWGVRVSWPRLVLQVAGAGQQVVQRQVGPAWKTPLCTQVPQVK